MPEPVLRENSKKILEEAYEMSLGVLLSHVYLRDSSKFGIGGSIASTSYHQVDKMTETYMETDRDGNVVFAVVPPCVAIHTLDKKEVTYDHIISCVHEARRLVPPKDDDSSGNCFNFGCTSSTENGAGTYLH
jgi:hypothetical protein